jgi:hypothetical protein
MHNIPIDILYLDYAKAFDTVPHERLLNQISSFGIKGNTLGWIRSFLTGRRQKVRINEEVSSWKSVDSGVPQGSVLGPTLFSMFVADVPGEVECLVSMFADDTKIYKPLYSNSAANDLNRDLNNLQTWSNRMQMKFHPDKCKVMHLGSNNKHGKYTLPKPDGETHQLEEAELEKDLGVTIDNKLKFTKHIDNIVSTANRVLGCLKHCFKYMSPDVFLQLYKAMVRPHLEYASCIWSPYLVKDRDKIERIQRRATRMVKELKHLPYMERLRQLSLPSLYFRRRRADMIQTFKLMHGLDIATDSCRCRLCPEKILLRRSENPHTRGHNLKLYKQEARGVRSRFFAARVVDDWNSLSEDTVNATTVNGFKAGLRRDWAGNMQYSYQFSGESGP